MHEIVKEIFQRDPSRGVNPDEVVVMGAAIQVGAEQAAQQRGAGEPLVATSPCMPLLPVAHAPLPTGSGAYAA